MALENIAENIRYRFKIEDTGMKVYEIVGAEVVLPFCDKIGEASMQPICLRNRSGEPAVIRDAQDNLVHPRYGLDHGTLICTPSANGSYYRIDTAVADLSVDHDEFL